MKRVEIHLKSAAAYYQSRQHFTPKSESGKETPDAYEERTWREKCTTDENGIICIPSGAFKQCFDRSAKMLSMQIPNKGKATYTKHFLAGIMVPKPLPLGVKKSDVGRITLSCNADGRRGSGPRVIRHFPQIKSWFGVLEVIILDDQISREVFERHAKEAGMLVGVGQNRPENGGSSGRFSCEKFIWTEL